MDDHDIRSTLVNPYYAITISPDLLGEHEPLVAKEDWIKANARLADELGFEIWANQLLTVLEGGSIAESQDTAH